MAESNILKRLQWNLDSEVVAAHNSVPALQIHLAPANLTTAIHYTLASHKQISTNFNAFKIHWHVSLQTLQNIKTTHYTNTQKTTLSSSQTKNRLQTLSSHIKKHLTNQQPTYLYNSLSFPSHCFYKIFWFTCSFHSICRIITWQKGFLCHRSTTLEFTPSRYPKLVFFTNIPFQAQNTPLQNCFPSLGYFPWPGFWFLLFSFYAVPIDRMTPSVRHKAIEVHYYYYYLKVNCKD